MERLQTFCDTASQSLSYPRHDGPVTLLTPEPPALHSGQGCSKQMMRTARTLGQSPYCCPSTSQQSKLLYNLLSNWPKDGSEQMSCLPIIEHQPVCHQTHFGNSESSASGPSMSNPPPFKFEFNGQLAPDSGRDLLMPYCRQRSQSMGSNGWNFIDMSRTSSHDSLTSYDSVSDENLRNHSPNQQQSEALLEVTRKKLMNLLMGGNGAEQGSPHSQSPVSQDEDMRSLSQPGSPPSSQNSQEVCRKYSEGSQRVHIKAKLQSARARYDHLPVDLSCKRKKFIRNVAKQSLIEGIEADILPDEGIDECTDHSILKSVLTGRGRSNSLSVFELRRLRMAGRGGAGGEGRNGHTLLNVNSDLSQLTGRISGRQRVTLAKKNLLPVIARISDRLNKIVEFAKSLPEFMRLSLADQKSLLTNACPRLLLLYMAETNLQFAVTTVPDAGLQLPSSASASNTSLNAAGQAEWETPTMQFVECVQNFIRKCQTVGISANEYFYMRMITLFHTGAGALERSHLADQMYSEARQDLQDLVQHNHPSEKLRYSTLLLSLHTLFGIHCGMLQALFCKHLADSGGIGAFINDALNAAAAVDESTPSN